MSFTTLLLTLIRFDFAFGRKFTKFLKCGQRHLLTVTGTWSTFTGTTDTADLGVGINVKFELIVVWVKCRMQILCKFSFSVEKKSFVPEIIS